MNLSEKILYINIGTPKACLFIHMSNRLLHELRRHPLLYYSVEESLISAKQGYYSIGIIVWYSLLESVLNANSKEDGIERNIPAHDILDIRPTKESYDKLLDKFEKESKKCYLKELSKAESENKYQSHLIDEWGKFMTELTQQSS